MCILALSLAILSACDAPPGAYQSSKFIEVQVASSTESDVTKTYTQVGSVMIPATNHKAPTVTVVMPGSGLHTVKMPGRCVDADIADKVGHTVEVRQDTYKLKDGKLYNNISHDELIDKICR